MAGLGAIASLAGTAISAIGSIAGGVQAQAAAEFRARQLEAKGKTEFAAAQREALDIDRQTRLMQSRAQAVTAASGAGGLDQTVLDIDAGIAREGTYRKLIAKYKGEDARQGYTLEAAAERASGKAAKQGAIFAGIGTIAGGLGRMFNDGGVGHHGSKWILLAPAPVHDSLAAVAFRSRRPEANDDPLVFRHTIVVCPDNKCVAACESPASNGRSAEELGSKRALYQLASASTGDGCGAKDECVREMSSV